MSFAGTEMSETGADIAVSHRDKFKTYKKRVREEIDNPMLQRVVPPGTVLPDVHLEYHQDGKTFGRQLGTYPLLVALPGTHTIGDIVDVAVVDHGYRSVTGVPYPLDLNAATMDELTAIPGIGSRRAGDLLVNRPYTSVDDTALDPAVDIEQFATVSRAE
jgi:radical SAM superfamily enzyme with C-terminal helix-hairpin-helix motif